MGTSRNQAHFPQNWQHRESYQREASVDAQNADVDGAGVVGHAETIEPRHVLHVMEVGDARHRPHERPDGDLVEDPRQPAPEPALWQETDQRQRRYHRHYLGLPCLCFTFSTFLVEMVSLFAVSFDVEYSCVSIIIYLG